MHCLVTVVFVWNVRVGDMGVIYEVCAITFLVTLTTVGCGLMIAVGYKGIRYMIMKDK